MNSWIRWLCLSSGQARCIYARILGVVQIVNPLSDNRMRLFLLFWPYYSTVILDLEPANMLTIEPYPVSCQTTVFQQNLSVMPG